MESKIQKIAKILGIKNDGNDITEEIITMLKKSKSKPNAKILTETKSFTKMEQLGVKGKDGNVYKVLLNGTHYALKQFRKNKSDSLIEKESQLLQKCSTKNISPKVIETNLEQKYIIMELLDESLFDVLKKSNGVMTLYQQEEFISILKKLDKLGIYHGDPSPLNFMFKEDKMKIIDFGFGSEIDDQFVKKYKTKKPNIDFMILGFILKMKEIGVNIKKNYSVLKTYLDKKTILNFDL